MNSYGRTQKKTRNESGPFCTRLGCGCPGLAPRETENNGIFGKSFVVNKKGTDFLEREKYWTGAKRLFSERTGIDQFTPVQMLFFANPPRLCTKSIGCATTFSLTPMLHVHSCAP